MEPYSGARDAVTGTYDTADRIGGVNDEIERIDDQSFRERLRRYTSGTAIVSPEKYGSDVLSLVTDFNLDTDNMNVPA